MDRPSARELELGRRVAVLEAEMAQMRAFVNVFRASMHLDPLQPPVPEIAPVPAHQPQAQSQPLPAQGGRRAAGIRIWIQNVNLFAALLDSTKKWLALPNQFLATSPGDAHVILVLVWSPGGRADVTGVPFASYGNKEVFAVVLAPGTDPVSLPPGHVPKTRTVSLLLNDDFDDLKDEKQRQLARQFRAVLKAELPGLQSRIESSVTTADSPPPPSQSRVTIHGLMALGAECRAECIMIGCQNQALYQCGACTGLWYCGEHAKCYDQGRCEMNTK